MAEDGSDCVDRLAVGDLGIRHRLRAKVEGSAVFRIASFDQDVGLADLQNPSIRKAQSL
jgi:hypothetical protein